MKAALRVRSRILLPSLGVFTFVLFANYSAVLSVLLPSQVAAIDPVNKVGNLALVASVSFAFTLLAQPLVGALSDRTRSRLGRRGPWMIVGSLVAGAFLLGMGGLESVFWLCVFWALIQFSLNGADVASSSYLVDGFPRARRGVAAGVFAGAAITGGAAGAAFAGALAGERSVAYSLLGVAVVAAAAGFVALNREPSTRALEQPRFSARAFLRGFWIDPRRHPDFAWVFASRLAFVLGYQSVQGYLLYILTDFIGIPPDEAGGLVGVLTVVGFSTILVSAVVGGWLSDRVGRRKPFVVAACLIVAVALVIPLVAPTTVGMIVFAATQGVGVGLHLACGLTMASEVLPHDGASAAKDLGLYNVATNLAQTLAPWVAVFAIGSLGGYPILFLIALGGVVVAGLLVLPIRGVR